MFSNFTKEEDNRFLRYRKKDLVIEFDKLNKKVRYEDEDKRNIPFDLIKEINKQIRKFQGG